MSTRAFQIPARAWTGFKGYTADATNCPVDNLAPPSLNVLIDENGVAHTRMGFEDTTWDLNVAGSPGRAAHHKRFDITMFALGTKLKYIDHNRSNAVVDTGITLTSGTVSRFSEYAGDLYLTNTTDGLRRIVVTKIATANTATNNLIVDTDGAARLSVFGLTSVNVLVNGTSETITGVNVSTGALTCTSTQGYSAGAIVVHVQDISSSRPKGSKVGFWKERMIVSGVNAATSTADQPTATLHFGKFATFQTLEDIIDFTYGSGGSTKEMVGKSGRITNFLATEDYLYVFKDNETYVISVADVNASTGASIPNLRSPIHGCVNEDCAADMGNGEIAFLTPNKRIIRVKIATDSGAPVVFPDESFDVPMRKLLRTLDSDQTGSLLFYHQGKRRLYVQVKMNGLWVTLCYDNTIGAWQPPQVGKAFADYFERNGIMYTTSKTDDTVYLMESTNNDNGAAIEFYIATGIFDVGNAQMDEVEIKGSITQQTTINVTTPVNGGTAPIKTISGTSYSYGIGTPLGSVLIGSTTLGGDTPSVDTADYHKLFDVFPSDANKIQLITYALTDSAFYSLKSFLFRGRALPTPSVSLS